MKSKLWLLQLPIIFLASIGLYIYERGIHGDLQNEFVRNKAFPFLRTLDGSFTNWKFRLRGAEPPKNKIVIIDIDDDALENIGRWPWHRDEIQRLVHYTFEAGAKVVGIDVVFSEEDRRIPDDPANILKEKELGPLIPYFETDFALQDEIRRQSPRLVLGWTFSDCQPAYAPAGLCQTRKEETDEDQALFFDKFAFDQVTGRQHFEQSTTPLLRIDKLISNLPIYNEAAQYAGFFNAWPDTDGYIRRSNLVVTRNNKFYPSLALEMARVGKNEDLSLRLNKNGRIEALSFAQSGKKIPVTPLGILDINFRGPARTFQYLPARALYFEDDQIEIVQGRKLASLSKKEILKDAYVLIGISALGVYDMRPFPFDHNTPGVEGHATILDNILSMDMLTPGPEKHRVIWLFLLMTIGAVLFAYATEKLESIPGLILFIAVLTGLSFADVKLLFENQINWNTSLLYIELVAIFMFTLAIKYVLEERNKKFIKGAFAKYVAPAIVDSILKDPSKLTVGGEKRDLSILFSDIRSFTSFSETMDAKALAQFLNDYLGIMTDLVFEHQGTLDKYIGDAVMAFWGAPLDQPHHAHNACQSAIQMMRALEKHQPRFKEQYGVDVNIGIGINSGPVNVGNMGSERIFEYTVIGDHVNLASRLEGLTKYYGVGIITSRFTLDAIATSGHPLPSHRVLDFVKVKGKKNAVELIQIFESELSPEGLRIFDDARAMYMQQQWDEAITIFKRADELLRRSPNTPDGPCTMYIDRCQTFKLQPPSADWDGSWEMTSK